MRILAAFMAISAIGFGLFTIVFGIVSPAQEPHAFHNAIVAALLIVISAPPVVAVAMAPDRAVRPLTILAVIGVAAVGTMALSLTLDPFTLPVVVAAGVLWALAPSRYDLIPAGRLSLAMTALSALAALGLIPYALGQAELQRSDHTSEHAAFFHWVETSFYAAAIPLLALLAAMRPAAYRMAAWCAAGAGAIMGGASLVLPEYASALPAPLAWAALLWAAVFVFAAERAARSVADRDGR